MASAGLGAAYRHLRDLFGGASVIGLGDRPLLARYARSKDPTAFEALVVRHGPMVLATCRAVLKNEHDVEDAFQATFLILAKRAHAIRAGDALGGWLHRVAYRASVEASIQARRRRLIETAAQAMAPSEASSPNLETELDRIPILHEEINRLADTHRLAVVLCDLEGLTYEQAAEQLQWTVPTLRTRLAKARQKLKSRLIRRGLTSLAVATVLAPKAARAAVPSALLKATLTAAATGATTTGAALLTQAVLKGMLMTKLKIATTSVCAAVVLASAGLIAAGVAKPDDPPRPPAKVEVVADQKPVARKPVEMIEVKGRVLSPTGQPVAGASIRGLTYEIDAPITPEVTSNREGRFSIRLAKSRFEADPNSSGYPWLVASAPGHGLGWTERVLRPDRPDEQVVTLTEEGPPIEGRLIDVEGRPVVGATVRATDIIHDEKGDLPAWIAKARNGREGNVWQDLASLTIDNVVTIEARTGQDGRFQLTGIGRDRIAQLLISGSGIATTEILVFSRDESEIRSTDRAMVGNWPFIIHPPRFQLALSPAKRVEGIARDKDSGQPIAGLEIMAAVFEDNSLIPAAGIKATTDSKGYYRLDGLPRASAYRLFVKSTKGLPYPRVTLKAPAETPGLQPSTFDFALKRGVIVRGKVTDKATGRPILGQLNYYTFANNPHLNQFPGCEEGNEEVAEYIDESTYQIIALPGRGLISFQETEGRYRLARGYEKIPGYQVEFKLFDTVPSSLFPEAQNIITEIVIPPDSPPIRLDLQADPGRSQVIEVVDAEGHPLGGTKSRGSNGQFPTLVVPQDSARIEINGLEPGKPRRVVVFHEKRKLIGSVLLKGDEVGPMTVKLQPWGRISGRIVDADGAPRQGIFIRSPSGSENKNPEASDILPGADWNSGIRGGNDGRFVVEGLVPGLRYQAVAHNGDYVDGLLFEGVTVGPGEFKDLGDLKLHPPKPEN